MKAGTLFVALVVAGACIAGIVWLAGGGPNVPESSSAEDKNALPISETGPYPKAVIPDKQFDFDIMGTGQEMAHTFLLKNEGGAPLQYKLKGIECTCTVSDMEEGKVYEIPVGGEAKVELKWTPTAPELDFVKSADIYTNDPDHQVVTFTVSGRVEHTLTVIPDSGWTLQGLDRNNPETLTGEIYSEVLDKFEITSVETSSDKIQASVEPFPESEREMRAIKSGYRIKVTFAAKDLTLGAISEKVTVHTDVQAHETVYFPLSGQFLGSITAVPYFPPGQKADGRKWDSNSLQIDLGPFDAAKGRQGWFKLLVGDMSDGVMFEVNEIQSSNESVTATVTSLPAPPNSTKQFALVTFDVKPGIRPGSYYKDDRIDVVLKTNHPYAPEIKFGLAFQAQ